jgi:hypothetical protein
MCPTIPPPRPMQAHSTHSLAQLNSTHFFTHMKTMSLTAAIKHHSSSKRGAVYLGAAVGSCLCRKQLYEVVALGVALGKRVLVQRSYFGQTIK